MRHLVTRPNKSPKIFILELSLLSSFTLILMVPSFALAQLAMGLGGTSADQGRGVAVDAVGNTYITGSFNGTVDFDPGPGTFELTAGGGVESAFVASYDPTGALRYALSFRGDGHGIAADSEGNVYVTGEIGTGGVDVDPGPDELILDWLAGRVFLVSYNPDGLLRFGFSIGGGIPNRIESGRALVVDGAGNVFLTGVVNDDTDFDPTEGEEIIPLEGISDSFLASYSSGGSLRFAIGIGGALSDEGLGVALDPAGNIYLTGTFRGTVDFDPGPGVESRTSNGNRDIYLASYSSAGGFRFASNIGAGADDLGNAIAVDEAGNSFLTGSFQGQADFDPGPSTVELTSAGLADCFLASYNAAGDYRFAFRMGNSNVMSGFGVALDAQGQPHVTGNFTNLVDFDPGSGEQILAGDSDTFVAGYTSTGEYRFAFNYEDVGLQISDSGQGIVLDPSGGILVTGTFGSTKDLDPGPGQLLVTSHGSTDVFLVRSLPGLSPVGLNSPARTAFTLSPAYPNPTAGRWQARLDMLESRRVNVQVYDLAGRLVGQLYNGMLPAGTSRSLEVEGKDLPSGIYFVRVSHPDEIQTSKVMVVR